MHREYRERFPDTDKGNPLASFVRKVVIDFAIRYYIQKCHGMYRFEWLLRISKYRNMDLQKLWPILSDRVANLIGGYMIFMNDWGKNVSRLSQILKTAMWHQTLIYTSRARKKSCDFSVGCCIPMDDNILSHWHAIWYNMNIYRRRAFFQDMQNYGSPMHREYRERFPRHRQRKPLVSHPGMHHGTCVTHVMWCMSGSLTRGGEYKLARHTKTQFCVSGKRANSGRWLWLHFLPPADGGSESMNINAGHDLRGYKHIS